jgi:preprotein translocase subunit SecD
MSRLVALPVCAAVLTVAISCAGIAQANPPGPVSPPILELRLASDKPAPGFSAQRNFESRDQPAVLYLDSTVVVSDADLVRARTRSAPDGLVMELTLSDAAAARLRETTANSIGKYMAVLAHGTFAGAATIMTSIPTRTSVNVGLTLPVAAADTVRSRVAARWPTRP